MNLNSEDLNLNSGPITLEKERHRSCIDPVTACLQLPGLTSCPVSPGTRDFVACNHLRSYKYYLESILNPDGFAAYPCASYKDFESVSYYSTMSEGHHTPRSYCIETIVLSFCMPHPAPQNPLSDEPPRRGKFLMIREQIHIDPSLGGILQKATVESGLKNKAIEIRRGRKCLSADQT